MLESINKCHSWVHPSHWLSGRVCAPMARETGVQSLVESYQRLKKWYLIPLCLTLSIMVRFKGKVEQFRERSSALFQLMVQFLHEKHFVSQREVVALMKEFFFPFKGQELISVSDQRIGWMIFSNRATRWSLLWMLGCFCCNLKNKANKWAKFCKTFE